MCLLTQLLSEDAESLTNWLICQSLSSPHSHPLNLQLPGEQRTKDGQRNIHTHMLMYSLGTCQQNWVHIIADRSV